MIVVDTNTIGYLTIDSPFTSLARDVYLKDSEWAAPGLWRSEYRSILALYMRKGLITFEDAVRLAVEAELLMAGREYTSRSDEVLRIVKESKLSAYDAEFIALARRLSVNMVTTDDGILKGYPKLAYSPQEFTKLAQDT